MEHETWNYQNTHFSSHILFTSLSAIFIFVDYHNSKNLKCLPNMRKTIQIKHKLIYLFYVEIAVSVNKLWWTIFSSCLLKCAFWVARMSQASHGHFFPSCRDCLCLFMIFFQSQWSHKHHMEIVSLYVQIVYASLGILYESHGSHKHHMNISSLHAHIV